MYVWNYNGNVPVVGVFVGPTVVAGCSWNLDLCWFDVVVQTSVVACLMSKMENGRSVELP